MQRKDAMSEQRQVKYLCQQPGCARQKAHHCHHHAILHSSTFSRSSSRDVFGVVVILPSVRGALWSSPWFFFGGNWGPYTGSCRCICPCCWCCSGCSLLESCGCSLASSWVSNASASARVSYRPQKTHCLSPDKGPLPIYFQPKLQQSEGNTKGCEPATKLDIPLDIQLALTSGKARALNSCMPRSYSEGNMLHKDHEQTLPLANNTLNSPPLAMHVPLPKNNCQAVWTGQATVLKPVYSWFFFGSAWCIFFP